jgi:hypothetical protein
MDKGTTGQKGTKQNLSCRQCGGQGGHTPIGVSPVPRPEPNANGAPEHVRVNCFVRDRGNHRTLSVSARVARHLGALK